MYAHDRGGRLCPENDGRERVNLNTPTGIYNNSLVYTHNYEYYYYRRVLCSDIEMDPPPPPRVIKYGENGGPINRCLLFAASRMCAVLTYSYLRIGGR